MNSIKSLILILLLPTILYSQINTELLRNLDTTNKQILTFSGTFYEAWGNTKAYDILTTGRYDLKRDNLYTFATALYQIRYDCSTCPSPIIAIDRASFHFRTTYKLTDMFIPEFYAQYNNDRSIKLRNRMLIGVGDRIQILNDSNYVFFYGPSLMYEMEEMFDLFTPIYKRFRWSNYISFIAKIKQVYLYETFYAQPNIKNFKDIRILNDLTAKVPIFSWLTYSLAIHYRYDNLAQFKLKQFDIEIYNTLEFIFNL